MTQFNRRDWIAAIGVAGFTGCSQPGEPAASDGPPPLDITEFQPKSMLHVPETTVEKARFPVIDIHTHLTFANDKTEELSTPMPPAEVLKIMDRRNLKLMVNLTGGHGKALEEAIATFQTPHPERFAVCTEPHYHRAPEPDYPKFQADAIESAHAAGARGLKVLKVLGLYLREQGDSGPLVKVDDPRFDPMWEACAALNMPVCIHTSDPEAFFLPIDRFNERFEELNAHPDWSFHDKDFPSDRELQEARFRVLAKHPKTNFVVLHVGNSENLSYISEALDEHPNMYVEIGARIGELGRQPRMSRKFFEKHQDRILFGTDAIPLADNYPQQIFNDELYKIYYRFLETEDEYFDYAPAPVPPQGRWRIYGLGLSEGILKKVYHDNAARLLGLPALV